MNLPANVPIHVVSDAGEASVYALVRDAYPVSTPPPSSLVVHGPAGSGKSRNATELGRFYGLRVVVDDAVEGGTFEHLTGVLYLSHLPFRWLRHIPIDVAIAAMQMQSGHNPSSGGHAA